MLDTPAPWKISLTTFNCAKAFPFDQRGLVSGIIKNLLPKDINDEIYVIGLQEFVAIWQGSFPTIMEQLLKSLADQIVEYLNSQATGKYNLVGFSNTGAIALLVFVSESLTNAQVMSSNYRCGYFWSNLKGAAAICCTLEKSGAKPETFTFICNHLTANRGEAYTKQRIKDYAAILATCTEEFRLSAFKEGHVFFMGDLNFRLEGLESLHTDYTSPEVISDLTQHRDELTICKNKGLIFREFEEADIRFPPTYKYFADQPNQLNPGRMPAWCDRILFRKYPGSNYNIYSYNSVERTPELQFSDHKPVRLIIEVPQLPTTTVGNFSRSIPSKQGSSSLVGDMADAILGYGGWAAAKKVHYWIIFFIVGFLVIKAL